MKDWRANKLMPGAIIPKGGTAREYKTGGWRSNTPKWDEEKCKQCLICWISCPEGAVLVKDGKVRGIDMDYCKGCGICVAECPFEVIEMVGG